MLQALIHGCILLAQEKSGLIHVARSSYLLYLLTYEKKGELVIENVRGYVFSTQLLHHCERIINSHYSEPETPISPAFLRDVCTIVNSRHYSTSGEIFIPTVLF